MNQHLTPGMFEAARDPRREWDDAPVLQAMFDYADTHPGLGLRVDWTGVYTIGAPITIKGGYANHEVGTIHVEGELPHAIVVSAPRAHFRGILRVRGGLRGRRRSATFYEDRACLDAVILQDCYGTTFDGFDIRGFRRSAVRCGWVGGSQIDCVLGRIIAWDCGSPGGQLPGHISTYRLAFTGRVDLEAPTSPLQRSRVTVDPDHDLRAGDLVVYDDQPYSVNSVDGADLFLFPHLPDGVTEGELQGAQGAALDARGGNTTGMTVARVSVIRCGVAVRMGGLYGPVVQGLTCEAACAAVVVGFLRSSAMLGGFVGSMHVELTRWHGIRVMSSNPSLSVGNVVIWRPERWVRLWHAAPTLRDWTLGDGFHVLGRSP